MNWRLFNINITFVIGIHEVSEQLTGAPRLDITEAPRLDITAAPSLDMTAEDGGLAQRTANLSLDDTIDPFHPDTQAALLASLATPVSARHGYVAHQRSMPAIRARATVTLGQDSFYISELKGEGGNAKVFAATRHDDDMDCTIAGIDAVLKVQKSATVNDWEFYLCTEVQSRLAHPCLIPPEVRNPSGHRQHRQDVSSGEDLHRAYGGLLHHRASQDD